MTHDGDQLASYSFSLMVLNCSSLAWGCSSTICTSRAFRATTEEAALAFSMATASLWLRLVRSMPLMFSSTSPVQSNEGQRISLTVLPTHSTSHPRVSFHTGVFGLEVVWTSRLIALKPLYCQLKTLMYWLCIKLNRCNSFLHNTPNTVTLMYTALKIWNWNYWRTSPARLQLLLHNCFQMWISGSP